MDAKQKMVGKRIQHEGETWEVLSVGVVRDGRVFCHLAHTTDGKQHRNGWYPRQINDWVALVK